MEIQDVEETSSRKRKRAAPETGPFVLRSLLQEVPLSAEGDRDDIEINCVEFLGTCARRWHAKNGVCYTRTRNLLVQELTPPRPESIRWNFCFGTPPLCTTSFRPYRCIRHVNLYPSLKTSSSLSRAPNSSTTRCPADPTSPQGQ